MKKKKTTKKKAVKKVSSSATRRRGGKKKGFTLIELLIVIAIIGILASVVLVSLSSARTKAQTANFKSQVASIQAAAIIQCDALAVNTVAGLKATIVTVGLPSGVTFGGAGTGGAEVVDCGLAGAGTFLLNVTTTASTMTGCNVADVRHNQVTFPSGC